MPARKQLVLAAKFPSEREKNFKIAARLARRIHRAIHFADAPLRIRVRAFLFAPDRGGKNQIGQLRGGRGMKTVLHDEEFQVFQALRKDIQIGIGNDRDLWRSPRARGSFSRVRLR